MNIEITIIFGLFLIIIAFCAEYMDSTLGMGYGTSLTPILLLLGFDPLQVVPSILLSELITGMLAGFTHHLVGNVDFRPKTMKIGAIYESLKKMGLFNTMRKGLTTDLKVAIIIGICSIFGTILAIFIAISLSKFYLKLYIAILILIIGLVLIFTINKNYKFSWKKIVFLGVIASFNKGISGGGYGPVVTGGQLIAGVDGKNAIGITSLAEGFTCLVGVIAYLIATKNIDWSLAPFLISGAVLSVPLSAYTVRKINTIALKWIIGCVIIVLGCLSIYKIVF